MAWKRLDINDLKKILSDEEANQLNTISTTSLSAVNDTIDIISDTWRGALQSKSIAVDVRDHYTPSSYSYWILVHARYAVWTRFPMSPAIALDDARKNEYDKALEYLASPSIAAEEPEWQHSSQTSQHRGSITLPRLRIDNDLYWYSSVLSIDIF